MPVGVSAASSSYNVSDSKLLTDVVSISAGISTAFAVKSDGSAWAWGGGTAPLGNGSTRPAYSPVKMHIDHVKQIAGGNHNALILKDDGTVWAIGANEEGQLGNGTYSEDIATEPEQVQGLSDIVSVAAGYDYCLALDQNGKVWAWGGNYWGQLGSDSGGKRNKPVQVKGLPVINAISTSSYSYTSSALDNGGVVWVWGAGMNESNQAVVQKPMRVNGNGEYQRAIMTGMGVGTALRGDGTVWMLKSSVPNNPLQITGLSSIVSITEDAAVRSDGTVWQWKPMKEKPKVVQVAGIYNAAAIVKNVWNHYVLTKDGQVLAWGINDFGEIGVGSTEARFDSPQPVRKSVEVDLNGQVIEMPMPPIIVHGSTYVALRGIFEKMGISIRWDVNTRSAIAEKGDSRIVLNSATGQTTVNGQPIEDVQNSIFVNDSIFVPLRLISEILGANVNWDDAANTVRIKS